MARILNVLVAEHQERSREILTAHVLDELQHAYDGEVAVVSAPAVMDAYALLRQRQFDVVVTDWMWPNDSDSPEGPQPHEHGATIAQRAKDAHVPLVMVVTREKVAASAARAHPSVDAVFLWEDLLEKGAIVLAERILQKGVATVDRGREVFVVYGHDSAALAALSSFLEDLDLRVLTFAAARERTAQKMRSSGRPVTTYDIVELATSEAGAVLCLLTPDEVARPRTSPRVRGGARPRPNVIFEAGLAFSRQPTTTLLIKVGPVETWSDVDGLQYATFSNDIDRKREIVDWLRSFGLALDAERADWRNKDYGIPTYP